MGFNGTLEAQGLYPRVRQTQAITWGAQMFHKSWFNNVFCHWKQLLLFSIPFTFLNSIKCICHVHHDSCPPSRSYNGLLQLTAHVQTGYSKQTCWYGNKPVGTVIMENEGESPLNSAANQSKQDSSLNGRTGCHQRFARLYFRSKLPSAARSIRPVRKHTTIEK